MRFIKPIILIQLFTLLGCSHIRNSITFFPDTESEISKENIPEFISEKKIETTDKETLQAFYFKHNDNSNHPLIIYFHGNAGNLYGRFGYAENLYKMNQNVLLISYRGYGKSSGQPSEEGIYIDGESAVDFAKDSLGYSDNEIIILGRSLGTTVAINTAQKRNFKGVILITPLTSGKDMATAMGMNSLTSVAGDSFNSIGKITNLKSPILIIHGTDDKVTPYDMGVSLFKAYSGSKNLVTIESGGHNNLQDVNPQQFWEEINRFINKI